MATPAEVNCMDILKDEQATLPTNFPAEAATFTAIDWGGYTPRGYDPTRKAGVIRGVPVSFLTSGEWLHPTKCGSSGTTIILSDKDGVELGHMHVPSMTVAMTLPEWPVVLTYTSRKKQS